MTPIQEVIVATDKGAQHTIHIIQPHLGASFSSEVIVFDPQFHTLYSSLVPIGAAYSTAEEAFANAFEWVGGWLQAKGQNALKITNPCNTEFLSTENQQSIVNAQGIKAKVEVHA